MTKLLKMSIVLLSVLAIISCNAPGRRTEIPAPEKSSTGAIVWKSKLTPYSVSLSSGSGFTFVGSKVLTTANRIYNYSVFKDNDGRVIYIIDYKMINGEFPKGADIFEPADVKSQDLLKYQPYQFTIWTGISKLSESVLTEMGIKVPECKVALNAGKLNDEDPSTAVFVIFIAPWNCARTGFEKIIDNYYDIVSIW